MAEHEADVGLGQGGCVVDAVADHTYRPPGCLARANQLQLDSRRALRIDFEREPKLLDGVLGGGAAIAGGDGQLHSGLEKPLEASLACIRLETILEHKCSSRLIVYVGVEVVFLNRALGQSPEDELLLQVQGMVAEYERAKILERSRRGKRHGAQTGVVSVLSGAPFGYRYIKKEEGGGTARFEIMLDEARIVRQVFQWVGQERATIGDVVRRLTTAKELTRTSRTVWDRTTVWDMLKNQAYVGLAAFGKTQAGPLGPRLRAQTAG